MFDVVIVGGGPAGLSAAVLLGRARRRVLVADSGRPRNAAASEVHNVLSRDGTPPEEIRKAARDDVTNYPTVTVADVTIDAVTGTRGEYAVIVDDQVVQARRLLLATGVVDQLPDVDGLSDGWGRTVLHCPYCHGYEVRDKSLAVLVTDFFGVVQATRLRSGFSDDVVACTNGTPLEYDQRSTLENAGVRIEERPLARFVDADDECSLEFTDGGSLLRTALFVHTPTRQSSELPRTLGCETLPDGAVKVDDNQQTTVAGVFAAGDLARRESMIMGRGQVAVAAAAGLVAAVAMDQEMTFMP